MPPSSPPARFVGRPSPCASSQTISSWNAAPRVSAPTKPDPIETAFTAWIDIKRLRDPPVEAAVPLGEGAESRHDATRHDLDDAADRVAVLLGAVDLGDHRGRGRPVRAANRALLDRRELVPGDDVPVRRRAADADDVAPDLGSSLAQQGLGERSRGHARGGLTGARPLEHVAQVGGPVLEGAGEVRVAGPRVAQPAPLAGGVRLGLRRHDVFPVLVVLVADQQRHRAAERAAVAHAREHLGRVLLDLHAAAAAVAALAAPQVGVDPLALDGDSRRKALDHDAERGSVRFARGEKAQHVRHRGVRIACCQGTQRFVTLAVV